MHNEFIEIYTDGSCEPNPGAAGIGILLKYGNHERRISRYIGEGTNNIAELEAIRQSLLEIKPNYRCKDIRIYSDSQYCIGVLSQGWKAKENQMLVSEIRQLLNSFKRLSFIKVKAHALNTLNNQTDALALKACRTKQNSDSRTV